MGDDATRKRLHDGIERLAFELNALAKRCPPWEPTPEFSLETPDGELALVARGMDGPNEETACATEDTLLVRLAEDGTITVVDDDIDVPDWQSGPGDGAVAATLGLLRTRCERRLGLCTPVNSPELFFTCAFCGSSAEYPPPGRPLCAARRCSCGAVGLSNPAIDRDEIIDDAIGLFGVTIPPEARGSDPALLEALRAGGIDFREGHATDCGIHPWAAYVTMWFRPARDGSIPP